MESLSGVHIRVARGGLELLSELKKKGKSSVSPTLYQICIRNDNHRRLDGGMKVAAESGVSSGSRDSTGHTPESGFARICLIKLTHEMPLRIDDTARGIQT